MAHLSLYSCKDVYVWPSTKRIIVDAVASASLGYGPTEIIDLFLGYFIKSRAAVIREAELTFLPSLLSSLHLFGQCSIAPKL